MKNMIPLIVAVVLGLAAVFAVSRALSKNGTRQYGKEVSVLVANGNLKRGSVMSSENFRRAVVPSAYVPKQHILGDQDASILGQTLVRDIAAGDYILWNDFGRQSSVGESVGEGEWAVPVSFENARQFAKQLKPGDEIAVVGMFEIQEEVKSTSADARAKPETVKRTVTTVLFPQVRIMSMSSDGSVLLSLPPQQALVAIAAQKQARLFVVLRRPHDGKATSRRDNGQFDNQAFVDMLQGCPKVQVPDQPSNKAK